MTEYRIRPGLTIRALPDGDAVVAGDGSMDAVIVNRSAHAILEMLGDVQSPDLITQVFCEAFPDQDREAIERDIAALLDQLVRAGIVEPCGVASSTA